MTDLSTLGGDLVGSFARASNDSGQVAGYSFTADFGILSGTGTAHAFIYSNGVMQDLNSLIPTGTGWVINDVNGINDNGEIVCLGTNGSGYSDAHALLLITTPQLVITTQP